MIGQIVALLDRALTYGLIVTGLAAAMLSAVLLVYCFVHYLATRED